jgi:hypothetical protein
MLDGDLVHRSERIVRGIHPLVDGCVLRLGGMRGELGTGRGGLRGLAGLDLHVSSDFRVS